MIQLKGFIFWCCYFFFSLGGLTKSCGLCDKRVHYRQPSKIDEVPKRVAALNGCLRALYSWITKPTLENRNNKETGDVGALLIDETYSRD